MSFFIKTGATTWDEINGTQKIHVKTGATTWNQVEKVWTKTGATTWTQVYQYDQTAPTIGTWTVAGNDSNQMTFAWSGGALVTDADAGVANVQVEYQYTPWGGSGEGWNAWQNWTASEWAASSGSYSFTVSTAKRPTQGPSGVSGFYQLNNRYYVDFRVTATDLAGNSTNKTIANGQLTRPYGTFYIVPQGSGSVSADSYQISTVPNGFYGLSSSGVRAGDATSVGGLNWQYGCWFYGDEIETYHLIKDASSNRYKADSGSLIAVRPAGVGNGGTFAFQQHPLRFSNGTTGTTFSGNVLLSTSMNPPGGGGDSTATMTLDSGHLTAFSTLSAKGFGQVRNSGSTLYRVCRNYLENLTASGQITLVFN